MSAAELRLPPVLPEAPASAEALRAAVPGARVTVVGGARSGLSVARLLARLPGVPVVLDPVLAAESGGSLDADCRYTPGPDVGLDLTAVRKHKVYLNNAARETDTGVVVLYDTGIALTPPDGYYVEIVPRSSISKTGWMLANNTGVIDPTYNGNIYIALVRVADHVDELPLPFCKCQLILRPALYPGMKEVGALGETKRGAGGFGSTSKGAGT